MKEKFNKKTVKKVAFYAAIGVAGFTIGRLSAMYGLLGSYSENAKLYHENLALLMENANN